MGKIVITKEDYDIIEKIYNNPESVEGDLPSLYTRGEFRLFSKIIESDYRVNIDFSDELEKRDLISDLFENIPNLKDKFQQLWYNIYNPAIQPSSHPASEGLDYDEDWIDKKYVIDYFKKKYKKNYSNWFGEGFPGRNDELYKKYDMLSRGYEYAASYYENSDDKHISLNKVIDELLWIESRASSARHFKSKRRWDRDEFSSDTVLRNDFKFEKNYDELLKKLVNSQRTKRIINELTKIVVRDNERQELDKANKKLKNAIKESFSNIMEMCISNLAEGEQERLTAYGNLSKLLKLSKDSIDEDLLCEYISKIENEKSKYNILFLVTCFYEIKTKKDFFSNCNFNLVDCMKYLFNNLEFLNKIKSDEDLEINEYSIRDFLVECLEDSKMSFTLKDAFEIVMYNSKNSKNLNNSCVGNMIYAANVDFNRLHDDLNVINFGEISEKVKNRIFEAINNLMCGIINRKVKDCSKDTTVNINELIEKYVEELKDCKIKGYIDNDSYDEYIRQLIKSYKEFFDEDNEHKDINYETFNNLYKSLSLVNQQKLLLYSEYLPRDDASTFYLRYDYVKRYNQETGAHFSVRDLKDLYSKQIDVNRACRYYEPNRGFYVICKNNDPRRLFKVISENDDYTVYFSGELNTFYAKNNKMTNKKGYYYRPEYQKSSVVIKKYDDSSYSIDNIIDKFSKKRKGSYNGYNFWEQFDYEYYIINEDQPSLSLLPSGIIDEFVRILNKYGVEATTVTSCISEAINNRGIETNYGSYINEIHQIEMSSKKVLGKIGKRKRDLFKTEKEIVINGESQMFPAYVYNVGNGEEIVFYEVISLDGRKKYILDNIEEKKELVKRYLENVKMLLPYHDGQNIMYGNLKAEENRRRR